MAFVLVRNNLVVKTINGVRPLKTAESANGGTRREVNTGVTIYVGGTVTLDSNNKVSAITDPNALTTAQSRREQVKQWLRHAEKAPVANWSLKDGDAFNRSANYWKWIEMIGAASSVDSNLSTANTWGWIEDEMENWSLAGWYGDHGVTAWKNLDLSTLTTTLFYSTDTSNGSPVSRSAISMPSSWNGLVSYIYE